MEDNHTLKHMTQTSTYQRPLVFGQRPASTLINRSPDSGYLIPNADGWLLVSARGRTRGVLRKSHGWTQETAEEALRLQEGDILL